MRSLSIITFFLFTCFTALAENGYELWLRYKKIDNTVLLNQYKKQIVAPAVLGTTPIMITSKTELENGLRGLLAAPYTINTTTNPKTTLIAGTATELNLSHISNKKKCFRAWVLKGLLFPPHCSGRVK